VLAIFLAGQSGVDEPWVYDGTTAELFRTVRVIGEQAIFVEVSPGHLINVAHIERIAEDDVEQPNELPGEVRATPIPGGPASCPHGFIAGTCSVCNREAPE
jgi:hypothetical protein